MSIKLDGKAVSARIKEDLRERVARLKEQGVVPGLGTLLVGSDPGSVKYVAGKHADCEEVGIRSIKRELPENATFEQIGAGREGTERRSGVHGIHRADAPAEGRRLQCDHRYDSDPAKDADGMHPYNLGELVLHVRGDVTTADAVYAARHHRVAEGVRHRLERQGGVRAWPWHHRRAYDRPAAG